MSAAAAGGRSVHENVRPVEPGQPSSRIALMPAARVTKEKKITAGTPRRSTARRSAGGDMPLLYVIPLCAVPAEVRAADLSGVLLIVVGSLVAVGEHPAKRRQDWFLAPARRRAAAADGPHPLDESTNDGEQHVQRRQPDEEPLHGRTLDPERLERNRRGLMPPHPLEWV